MAQSVIGALRVNLGIDSAQFQNGLKNAQSGLSRFGSQLKTGLIAAAVAGGAALAGLAVAMRGNIKEMDKLAKLSRSIGVPVEDLSALRHAADLSGVSLEQLGNGIARLSRNMADAQRGLATPKAAFAKLGIEIETTDGQLKSVSQILPEIADRFAKLADGTAKTAVAQELFGRAGKELIPLLNSGAAGLRAMMAEAEALGLVIDTKTAHAAERFNDNLTRLGRVKDGIITKLTAHMLPAFERLSQRFIDAAKNGQWVERVAGTLSAVMDGLTRAVIFVYDNMGVLVRVAGVFIGMRIAAAAVNIAAAFLKFATAIRAASIVMAAFHAISRLSRSGILLMAGAAALAIGQFDKLKEGLGKLWKFAKQAVPDSIPAALMDGLKAAGLDISALEMDLKGLSTETYNTEESLKRLGTALGSAGESAGKAGGGIKKLMTDTADSSQQVSSTLQSSFSSAFDSLVDGTFNAREALAGLLKDLSRLAINDVFRSIMGGGGSSGGGFLGGLGSLFGGRLPGFATGGSFTVGGAGGIDSQLVAFRATPGETVDVRRQGQMRAAGGVTIVNQNDFRGADPSMKAYIDGKLAQLERNVSGKVKRDFDRERRNNPNFYQTA